ncbi:hypothetical protein PIB30_084197, partial [Stylosanthes scabra]|nr:hypothetical protein [Stylosanthes scabra]
LNLSSQASISPSEEYPLSNMKSMEVLLRHLGVFSEVCLMQIYDEHSKHTTFNPFRVLPPHLCYSIQKEAAHMPCPIHLSRIVNIDNRWEMLQRKRIRIGRTQESLLDIQNEGPLEFSGVFFKIRFCLHHRSLQRYYGSTFETVDSSFLLVA